MRIGRDVSLVLWFFGYEGSELQGALLQTVIPIGLNAKEATRPNLQHKNSSVTRYQCVG